MTAILLKNIGMFYKGKSLISRIVNEPSIDYDTSKLMQALYALNDEAHKNGTAGMSEEEIEAEIKAVRHSRASGL